MARSQRTDAVLAAALAAAGAVTAAVVFDKVRRRQLQPRAAAATLDLWALSKGEVPACLRSDFYFDFEAHPFEHAELLTSAHDVVEVLGSIHEYAVKWLLCHSNARDSQATSPLPATCRTVGQLPSVFLEADTGLIFQPDVILGTLGSASSSSSSSPQDPEVGLHICRGVQVLGGTFDLRSGGIWLGEGVVVDPGVHITGPAIIGARTHLRPGAYLRGDVIIGEEAVLRGELKNVVIMDAAELAHPGYCGDSLIGWKGHFGCQALTANLGLFGAMLSLLLEGGPEDVPVRYSLGRRKVGIVLGDCSQLGCNSVTDPGTFLGPRTHVYPLTRLAAGVYGPDEIVKNRPELSGAIVREALRPASRK